MDSSVGPFTLDDVRRALRHRPPSLLPEPLPRRASVAIVLHEAASGVEALFIRRAVRAEDPWSGQVAFPGGRAEPGESRLETAVRETVEEVGLDLAAAAETLGALDEIQAIGRSRPMGLSIQPWVFGLRGRPDPLRTSSEVASVHWLRLAELVDPSRVVPYRYVYQGTVVDLPSVRAESLVIWGLSYRMLQSFADVVKGAADPAPRRKGA